MNEHPQPQSHWKARGAAAALFGSAAALNGVPLWALFASEGDVSGGLVIGAYAVLAAVVVGVAGGPKLHSQVAQSDTAGRGVLGGLSLTIVAYLLGVLVWVTHRYLLSPGGGLASDLDFLSYVGFIMAAGSVFVLPTALIFGALAGWAFGWLALRGTLGPSVALDDLPEPALAPEA